MATRRAVRIYDAGMKPVGELRTARIEDLKLRMAPVSTAMLVAPEADAEALGFRSFVELFDAGGRRIDLFRVSGIPQRAYGAGGVMRVACDQALCVLKDDILPGYVQLGGATQDLRGAIESILAYQTGPVRWELDRCDFKTRYEYGMSCENLLSALLKLLEPLEDWMIATDTTGGRLRLSVLKLGDGDAGELRYGRNMSQVTMKVSEEGFATRLYPLGYGEGVNQLNICSVNGGVPYIDAPTASVWGIVARPYVDTTITDATTLLAAAKAALSVSQNPQVSYGVTAADLSLLTGEAADAFYPGRMMRVIHKKEGIALRTRVTEVIYPDPIARPGEARLTLATQTRDVATVIAELTRRSYESRLYGQGSTFIFADSIEQNADADTPAEGDIYIPANMIHVNAVKLKVKLMAYRADSKGAADGGGTTRTTASGGGSTQTSSSGGGTERTSSAGGGQAVSVSQKILAVDILTTAPRSLAGGATITETGTGGPMSTGSGGSGSTGGGGSGMTSNPLNGGEMLSTDNGGGGSTSSAGGHRHDVNAHAHTISAGASYTGGAAPATDSAGSHSHTIDGHTHGMKHWHQMPEHTHTVGAHSHSIEQHNHGMNHNHQVYGKLTVPGQSINIDAHTHSVKIPDHEHTVTVPSHTHSLTMPDHTHKIEYGIHKGPRAAGFVVEIDGTAIPDTVFDARGEGDIAPYLAKDADGRIKRSHFHVLSVRPVASEANPQGLCRIRASWNAQVFISSLVGVQY